MANPIIFATQSYRHPTAIVSSQRVVNGYAQAEPRDAKTPVTVLGCPGIEAFSEVGTGPIRAAIEVDGIPYVVSGEEMYEIAEDGTATNRTGANTIGGGGNVISIDTNGIEIVFLDGAKGWSYDIAGTTLAEITDADFIDSALTVAAVGGYMAFDNPGTDEFFISDLLDATAYSALDYASADSMPDRVRSVANDFGLLDVFGEKSIEFWQNTGAISFPFQPIVQGTIPIGIAGPLARVGAAQSMFFIGHDKIAYQMTRGSLQRISTHAIEAEWGAYTTLTDAFCFYYSHEGHKFVFFTFPGADKTWCFDLSTRLWHERATFDVAGFESRWRVNCAVEVFGRTMVGDANSGKLGFLSSGVYTEWGDTTQMHLIAPPIHGEGDRVSFPMFELDMETGVGNTVSPGDDPQAILDWRDDGNLDWVTALDRSVGRLGDRMTRMQWAELGMAYQRTYRLRLTDPVKRAVLGARCPGMVLVQG